MLKFHGSLHDLPQYVAEMHYIIATQQLEGYGLELFPAKVDYL